jgi:hypothetical protein
MQRAHKLTGKSIITRKTIQEAPRRHDMGVSACEWEKSWAILGLVGREGR